MALGGVSEVCEELGISRQRLMKLRERPDFPDPIADLSSGPVWDLADIRRFDTTPRTPGRPSKEGSVVRLGGRFELEEPAIGSGGFADVYRATDLAAVTKGLQATIVAVKVLRRVDDEDSRHRFEREMRMLEEIDHPNVMPVIASGADEEGQPWYAMPLALGDLDDLVQLPGVDDAEIVDVMRQIGSGLEHLHERKVWHRDLTPKNVLRRDDGSWAIADFGLAREAERRTVTLTTTAMVLGTYYYAAPEQQVSLTNAGPDADMYSLGKVLEAMVRGTQPIPNTPLPQSPFRQIIERATESDPASRYQSIADFLDDVERVVAAPGGRWETTEEARSRVRNRLQNGFDVPVLNELLLMASNTDLDDVGSAVDLSTVIVHLQADHMTHLWSTDPSGLKRVFDIYGLALSEHSRYDFGFCDPLADFVALAISSTDQDDDIVRIGSHALAELGYHHHRWHVRKVLHQVLQNLDTTQAAFAGLAGLRRASDAAIRFNFHSQSFVMRSLHPVLRTGIDELLARAQEDD